MLYKVVALLGLQLVSATNGYERGGDPRCVCDAYYGGLTYEDVIGSGTAACMKWHENNPDAVESLNKLNSHGTRDKRKLLGYEEDSYQIICMPTDKNIKVGAPEEFSPDWTGGCPADMDRCRTVGEYALEQAQKGKGSEPMMSAYHYENDEYSYQCQCDNYRGGASPATTEEKKEMCITFYEPGEHELFPEGERGDRGDRRGYNRELGRVRQRYFSECTPRSNAYNPLLGEGFSNYGCDHPGIPCFEYGRRPDPP